MYSMLPTSPPLIHGHVHSGAFTRHSWLDPDAPLHTSRHNRRAYIRSDLNLGLKWVLSQRINRQADLTAITWRKP